MLKYRLVIIISMFYNHCNSDILSVLCCHWLDDMNGIRLVKILHQQFSKVLHWKTYGGHSLTQNNLQKIGCQQKPNVVTVSSSLMHCFMSISSAQNEYLQTATLHNATLKSSPRCCARSYSISKTSRTDLNESQHLCTVLM